MTKLLAEAIVALRELPDDAQDRIAAQLMSYAEYISDVQDDD
jgi:hypothetical protein